MRNLVNGKLIKLVQFSELFCRILKHQINKNYLHETLLKINKQTIPKLSMRFHIKCVVGIHVQYLYIESQNQ